MRLLTVTAVAVAGLALSAGPAVSAAQGPGARWNLNERAGSTVAHDSVGSPNHGAIRPGARIGGGVVNFTGGKPIRVRNGLELNPRNRNFTAEVRVKFAKPGEYNLLQKGQSGSHGYKIDITGRDVYCVIKDRQSKTRRTLWGNGWHTIGCRKQGNRHWLIIDGKRAGYIAATPSGPVTNDKPVFIGGKEYCSPDCDRFVGQMDWARITYS